METTLHGKLCISGIMTTFSYLCIGSEETGNSSYLPKTLVRHPIDLVPIIPGSSLKGAVRRALLRVYPQSAPPEIFDTGQLVFRDAILTEDTVHQLMDANDEALLSTIKLCSRMDRITSQGSMYAVECIPPGAHFAFEIFYALYHHGEDRFATLLEGLEALELLMVGAHGSRGHGKVKFGKWRIGLSEEEREQGIEISWRPAEYYKTGSGEKILIDAEKNLGIPDVIAQYESLSAAWQ